MNDPAPVTANTEGVRIRGDGYSAEAGWFGPEDRPRFGWLYRPDTPAENGVGIVIVPPFGFEAICAHRTLRHLAEDAAKAGFFVTRFDLDGSGDSAGDDADPDRITAWTASIHDACDLVRSAGATQLVLIGARLGATLAALAAPSRSDIAALIAINGVVRGRDFLREARALQAAMGLRPPPEPLPDDGNQEVNGFVITAQTQEQIHAIDLATSSDPPAPRVLLIERDDMPERKRWPEHLRALGAEVGVQRLPGLVDMLDMPHRADVPQATVDACIAHSRQPAAMPGDLPGTPAPTNPMRTVIRLSCSDAAIVEQAVLIDDAMFGILSRPTAMTQDRGIALLNAGAAKHIGPNRMYVAWARRWAAHGRWVLRADLSGIGDSITRSGGEENQVYGQHGIDDAVRVVTWLQQRTTGPVVACGACSGAYHALRASLATDSVGTLILANPGALQYIGCVDNATTDLNDHSYYNNQIKGGRGLRKVLSGKVPLRKLIKVAHWYATTYWGMLARELLRVIRRPLHNDLGTELRGLINRGVRIHFIFSADDLSRANLAAQAGSMAKRLVRQGRVQTEVIDGPDHTFTQRWTQRRLDGLLDAILIPTEPRQR